MPKLPSILFLAGAVSMAAAQSQPTLKVGDPAPPIKVVKWIKGQPVTQLGNGKVHVVEFWATWCGPCRESIPHLTELAKKYKGKATFVGVSAFEVPRPKDESYLPKVVSFVKDMGDQMSYNVAADGKDGYMGKNWMEAAGQGGIPTAFVVDQKGRIAWIGHPMIGLDEVVSKVVAGKFDVAAEVAKQKKQQDQAEARAKVLAPLREKLVSKDHAGAVAEIEKLIAADPSKKSMLAFVRLMELRYVNETEAQKFAAELADGSYKDNAVAINQIVYSIVDDKSPVKNIDHALTIRLAERAVDLSKGKDPNILDTLALTYFKAGKTDSALSTLKNAIALAEADKEFPADALAEMKERLETFTAKKG